MSTPALSVTNLTKTYGNNVEALKGVSLEVAEGDFFALLGPNGAGKSTLIGIVTSLVNKTAGDIKVLGYDFEKNRNKVKSLIGLVPQEFNFNIFETVQNIVVQQGGYYGLPYKEAVANTEEYLHKLDLYDKRNTQAMRLSGGMKRRLMIARALVHRPKLLFLDEPTAGVDIELRRTMWDFIIELNKAGTTIILTTHYLEEAENLCRNIAIIDHGEIVIDTSMAELLQKLDTQTIIAVSRDRLSGGYEIDGYGVTVVDDFTLEIEVSKHQNMNELFAQLNSDSVSISSIRNKTNRLEELFVKLVSGAGQ